jgi:oxygen-independent coproporphyrinogen III oxidase
MNIILTSHSLSRSELEAGLSLTRAFFPEARVWVDEAFAKDSSAPAELIGRASRNFKDMEEFELIQMEVEFPTGSWRVLGYYHLCQMTAGDEQNPIQIVLNQVKVQSILNYNQIGKETDKKLLLKHGLYTLLSKVTGHTPPWGILTGIRPSKILHRLNDLGTSEELMTKILRERYAIREDKVNLLQEIVGIQSPYLKEMTDHPERVAVYVGIPFCPTRCTYCSFPAYSLQRGREPLHSYLQELYEEIRVTGEWMKARGLTADSLYIGGGTPTILTTSEISDLLRWIRGSIPTLQGSQISGVELTVEAGRPDTLSKEKLQALREQGVTRLSINPQTMHNRTLERIGRSHSVEEILEVYKLAREIPGWIINMDLILGLPGETAKAVEESLRQVAELNPDNLTVHSLAIKRGSKEHEAGLTQSLSKEIEIMQDIVLTTAQSIGMRPYYLYRQKHIAGNLENIGFARPGAECRYNIGIMEERQSVIGIGAGSSSKIVNPKDLSLVNLQHPSNWQTYMERWREIKEKRQRLFGL